MMMVHPEFVSVVNFICCIFAPVLFFTTASAEWCTSNGEKVTQCPNYKDAITDIYCCTSEVRPGDFFCCNEAQKRAQTSSETNIKKYLPYILGVAFVALCLLVVLGAVSCFFCKTCPFYKWKRKSREASRYSSPFIVTAGTGAVCGNSYVQVNTVEPKPSPYDAPPPYTYAEEYPPVVRLSAHTQQGWSEYCLENEENNSVEERLRRDGDLTNHDRVNIDMESSPQIPPLTA